jgi:hypothetical protein
MHYREPQRQIVTDSNYESFIAYKSFCYQNKWLFIALTLLLCFGITWFYKSTFRYESRAVITYREFELPEDKYEIQNGKKPAFTRVNENSVKLFQFIYKKEMIDHLITKFNLYTHYGIDPGKENAYARIRKQIKSKIKLVPSENNMLVISVKDRYDNRIIADIANEIAIKLNEYNIIYFTEYMEMRMELYNDIYKDIKSKADVEIVNLNQSVDNMKSLISSLDIKYSDIVRTGYNLSMLNDKINDHAQNLIELNHINKMAYQKLKNEGMNMVKIVEEALPDDGSDKLPLIFILSGAFITSLAITIFSFYLLLIALPYIKLL